MSFVLLYLLLGWVTLNSTMLICLVLAAKLLSNAICYVNKVMELYCSQQQSLSNATRNQPKSGIIIRTPLRLTAQPIFHPPHWPLIQSLWSQVDYKPCCQRSHPLLSFYLQSHLSHHNTQLGWSGIFHLAKPVMSVLSHLVQVLVLYVPSFLSVLSQLVWVLMSFIFPIMAPTWL